MFSLENEANHAFLLKLHRKYEKKENTKNDFLSSRQFFFHSGTAFVIPHPIFQKTQRSTTQHDRSTTEARQLQNAARRSTTAARQQHDIQKRSRNQYFAKLNKNKTGSGTEKPGPAGMQKRGFSYDFL